MSTLDAESAPIRSNVPPSSPLVSAAWLLRATALTAVVSGALGIVVAPGVRGNAGERIVDSAEKAAAAGSYFFLALLLAALLWATVELAMRARGVWTPVRLTLVGLSSVTLVFLALGGLGLRDRLPELLAVGVSATTSAAALAAATSAVRTPHTRALSGLLLAAAFASIARLGAWEVARFASERASLSAYGLSRGLATAGVVFEACGQLVAVTWLGTRTKLAGQVGAVVAIVIAVVVTWGVAKGVHSGASLWQSVLHTALADSAGVPQPYSIQSFAIFLVSSSLLLALVAAVQPNEVVAVVAAFALALVSRGSFDAPLRALCGLAAAGWAALASADERAMWRTLIQDRQRKLADS
ncbi:MAG TPA: hypothetical protein VF765_17215 [Polyangiaceae bacterium]